MSQTFNDFLHSTGFDSMPKEILGLGRRWLLDLFGVAAGAIETSMSRIIRDHVAEHFMVGQCKVLMQSPTWGMKGNSLETAVSKLGNEEGLGAFQTLIFLPVQTKKS